MYADFDPKTEEISLHKLTKQEAIVLKRFLQIDRKLKASYGPDLAIIDKMVSHLTNAIDKGLFKETTTPTE